jgi:hypothetical protein
MAGNAATDIIKQLAIVEVGGVLGNISKGKRPWHGGQPESKKACPRKQRQAQKIFF